MDKPYRRVCVMLFVIGVCVGLGSALHATPPEDLASVGTFRVPRGLTVEMFAEEPQLANPVAFCLDEKGRVYVAEEYRFNRGTEENRTRPFLLEDDLQLQTVDDRLAMLKKWSGRFEGGMEWFSKYADQVRLLEDKDGDGKADRALVFAGDFKGPLDGLASGVIARDGDVYLTCIPNLWRLRDEDGDGKAEVRQALLHGFGVNAAFLGHDLHGLVWGPDGKLYFSVGDRGFHVKTLEGKVIHGPRTGGVFRCAPDGSGLEVVARGLRNPQELAFDVYGNLFAVDNNCDKGDHSRLVAILEGGDSGWNMAYQTIPEPYLTGPWHAERLWHLSHEGQAAWIIPPVGKIGAGPSGFVAYPGVGLPDRYRDHFFYCNYTSNGGVESFTVNPKGAGFELVDLQPFLTPMMATDVDFGYDGKMYVSEFGRLAWDGSNQSGRLFTVFDPKLRDDPTIRQVERLFKEGFRHRSIDELSTLLSHPDQRVRLRAQYALAEQGEKAGEAFVKMTASGNSLLTRLHAVWGLGQVGNKFPKGLKVATQLLEDPDAKLRGQAAKVLGDARFPEGGEKLVGLLKDSDAQVCFQAMMSLGKLRHRAAIEPILARVRQDAGHDPFLRHAAVMALLGMEDPDALLTHSKDESPAVRMVVLLCWRRLADSRIVAFLGDADRSLVTEAARAINDVPVPGGTEALARLLDHEESINDEALARRAINANFRLGGEAQALALVATVADSRRSLAMRSEALAALADWDHPSPRDRVTGFWRPLEKRDSTVAHRAFEQGAATLLEKTSGSLQAHVIELLTKQGGKGDEAWFLAQINDPKADAAVRLASIRYLAGRKAGSLKKAVQSAIADQDPLLRAEGRRILASLDPEYAVALMEMLLKDRNAPVTEQQLALETLTAMGKPQSDALLREWVGRLEGGDVPAGIQLDVIEAAVARGTPELIAALDRYRKSRSQSDPLAVHRPSLEGGNAERGRALFVGHQQAQCIRCHRVGNNGGTAGPDLSKVATRGDREFFLQSMVDPDAKIAPDFGTILLALRDGRVVTGTLKSETKQEVVVESNEGLRIAVPANEIEERSSPQSAMPKMSTVLSPREFRDIVEYLTTLK